MEDFPWVAVIAGILAYILVALVLLWLGVPTIINVASATIALGITAIAVAYWRY